MDVKHGNYVKGRERKLRVFENRTLRQIFGPRREEIGSWRIIHKD